MTVGDLEGDVYLPTLRISCLGHCGPDLPASALAHPRLDRLDLQCWPVEGSTGK